MNKRVVASIMIVLCSCSMAANAATVFMGKSDGTGVFEHVGGTSYNFTGAWGAGTQVIDIAVVDGGMHVMATNGLTYFEYDSVSNTLTAVSSFGWGADTGRCVAVASDGTVYAGGSTGFGSFSFDPNAPSNHYGTGATDWHVCDAYNIAIDTNDHIHVQQADGLSAWDRSGGKLLSDLTALSGWDGDWRVLFDPVGAPATNFTEGVITGAIAIDSSNMLHVGKWDGIGNITYVPGASPGGGTPFGYTWAGGWSGTPSGINDISIDEASGQIWAAQGDGVQVVDQSTYALLAYGGFAGGINTVCVDSDGNAHLGKSDGMMSVVTQPGANPWEDVVYDGSSWYAAADVTAIAEYVLAVLPPPPMPVVWIDSVNLYWTSTNTVLYAVSNKTDLVVGGWVEWTNGISATPFTNSLPLPLGTHDTAFFKVKAYR